MIVEALVGAVLFAVVMYLLKRQQHANARRQHEKFMHDFRRQRMEEERSRQPWQ